MVLKAKNQKHTWRPLKGEWINCSVFTVLKRKELQMHKKNNVE